MGPANQNIKEEHSGDHVVPLQEPRACGSRSHHKANHVKCKAQHCQHYPSPGAHPLASHWVVRAGAVEQHAACQPNSNTEQEYGPVSPHVHVWLYERSPGEDSEDESHQEDMTWIGHAEELRCEGRLVSGVCERTSDTVHASRGLRRRLEVSVGASHRRRRRLEIWVVTP
eukprot:scaffold37717_cov64-Phaeocystis_antarctica.AAC.2